MYGAKHAYYYDHDDYAIVYLHRLRAWCDIMCVGYKVNVIAEVAGISRTTIWRFKSGKSVTPKTAYLLAVGFHELLKERPATRSALVERFGVVMEVQKALF